MTGSEVALREDSVLLRGRREGLAHLEKELAVFLSRFSSFMNRRQEKSSPAIYFMMLRTRNYVLLGIHESLVNDGRHTRRLLLANLGEDVLNRRLEEHET